jgi:hypothetical protein
MSRMLPTFASALVATILAAVAPPAIAADPPAQTGADSVISSPEKLLVSLSNPDWRARRDAIHQLIQLGGAGEEAVRDLLRQNLDHEQRKNVGLALQLIQDNRLFGPSLITVHVKGASASDVFNSMGRQAYTKLPVSPTDLLTQDRWPKINLDLDHVTFWDAMRELGNRLNIDYLSDSQEFRITRGPGHLPTGTVTQGAFLLTARAGTMRRGMSLELGVYPEPKITVLRTTDLKLDRAVDDHGNPLTSQSGRGFRGGRGFGGRFGGGFNQLRNGPRLVSGIFQRPPEAEKIGELRGQFTVCVLGGTTRWEIPDPLSIASVGRTVDSIPVTLEALTGAGDRYLLKVSIPFGWSSSDSQLAEIENLMQRGLRLLDASARQLTAGTPDHNSGSETTDIEMTFSTRSLTGDKPTGPPARLVWEIPEKTRDVTIPFNFKNIPINEDF